MATSYSSRKKVRKNFGRIQEAVEMPNLIRVQKSSYDNFLQTGVSSKDRIDGGLEGVFKSVFPISDFSDTATLEYVSYELEEPKYDVEECQQRDMTYAAPLRVTLRLIVFDIDEETEAKSVLGIKEQDVYMGDLPLMTDRGTFVVNGTERVIVSQMHRSPGVFFDHDKGKTHASGKFLFAARIIPYRGSWLDFEFDAKDICHVRFDRRRKMPSTTLLYALGMKSEEILDTYYDKVSYKKVKGGWSVPYVFEQYRATKALFDLVDASNGEVVVQAGKKITPRLAKKLEKEGLKNLLLPEEELIGRFAGEDLVNGKTGEIYIEAGVEITAEHLEVFADAGYKKIETLAIDHLTVGAHLRNTLMADKCECKDSALAEIYRVMRPGEPPTKETAEALFEGLFFDAGRYDLSAVGRVKMNMRMDLDCSDEIRVLRKDDILAVLHTLLDLKDGKGNVDDIDHLGNRRVRSVGELMENQYRIGLLRMERAIRERMSSVDVDTVMPHDLVNAKPAVAAVREFFGSSQLSQFMDQTNPLSEITHKRRLSALGPGGLTRERAGFEVRDVHTTHYGRMCPIETPEGPNIGLINSLATFAKINKYGFIEAPYRKVIKGKITEDVIYLSAMEEEKYTIAQANSPLASADRFADEKVDCRLGGDHIQAGHRDIDLMDVSPKQVVSVAAALIPFLENDDANRALMGSNMQRQAVPLLKSESPFVGTGMERIVARDSGASVVAERGGVVDQVDATRVVIRVTDPVDAGESAVDIYTLRKFQRSNQDTCINQTPIVKVGDKVKAEDVLADGPATDMGELALGRNVLVAFMPWNGYNFEDSILISERIVKDDVFTSVHIDEFEVMARDTKLGPEDITRDIPNVGEEGLRNLDEAGIVHLGAEVHPGDILVGKITPKGESPMTPEEKLLRAIFGEKASDVRDSSMRLPPGVAGTVVEVRVFNRHGIDKDERAISIEREEIERLSRDREDEQAIIDRSIYVRLQPLLVGQTITSGPKEVTKGDVVTSEMLLEIPKGLWWQIAVKDEEIMEEIDALHKQFESARDALRSRFELKIEKLQRGDELLPGVLKMVKVFVAVKRKLQPGDKMAGRHGNKGVISRILPEEDMPYLEDGTPVDLCLNPLGVPSRMNVGQILETHLGWASRGLGVQISAMLDKYGQDSADKAETLRAKLKVIYGDDQYNDEIADLNDEDLIALSGHLRNGVPMATPVFDGAHEPDIVDMLKEADLDGSGQVDLYDGRTGIKFDRKVTVGYIYMLKLHHLVDNKIHARSIGPYSLVTQQPLGGKAQFGGQRFGEMEVWALQAYGAAYTLQEMLTVKSDDVNGRTKVYESIVRGNTAFEAGIPESFNVLVKEMKSLCLNVELLNTHK